MNKINYDLIPPQILTWVYELQNNNESIWVRENSRPKIDNLVKYLQDALKKHDIEFQKAFKESANKKK